MITDLLKLDAIYGKYKDKKLSDDSAIDESILVNSDKVVLAIIGFIVKVKRGLVDPRKIKQADQWDLALCKDDIQGGFLVDIEDNQKIIEGLFTYLNHGLFNVYKANEQDEKSVSNFFKTDAKYREKILRHFVNTIYLSEFELESFSEKFLGILK